MLNRTFGWEECPSVTEPIDHRDPQAETSYRFYPLGVGFKDNASVLHIRNTRLLNL